MGVNDEQSLGFALPGFVSVKHQWRAATHVLFVGAGHEIFILPEAR